MFTGKRLPILISAVTLLMMSTAMAQAQVQAFGPVRPAAVAGTVQPSADSESTSPAGKYYKVSVNGGMYTGVYCLYFDPGGRMYGFINPGSWGPPTAPPAAIANFWIASGVNFGMLGITYWGSEGSLLFLSGVFASPSLPFFGSGHLASVNCR
jgi:hypothetical protein